MIVFLLLGCCVINAQTSKGDTTNCDTLTYDYKMIEIQKTDLGSVIIEDNEDGTVTKTRFNSKEKNYTTILKSYFVKGWMLENMEIASESRIVYFLLKRRHITNKF